MAGKLGEMTWMERLRGKRTRDIALPSDAAEKPVAAKRSLNPLTNLSQRIDAIRKPTSGRSVKGRR